MRESGKFPRIESAQFRDMGTDIDIQIVVGDAAGAAKARLDLGEVREKYRKIGKTFSRFDAGSELSCLNSNTGKPMRASAGMIEVAGRVLFWNAETGGYFDPRIIGVLEDAGYDRDFPAVVSSDVRAKRQTTGFRNDLPRELLIEGGTVCFFSRMDFSGIVKGWATDAVARFLFRQGWHDFLVDSGGDMFFAGKDEEGKPWLVDVEGIPSGKMTLELSGEAVATSGISRRKWESGGERFHHLVNPKDTAAFSFELRSVTAVAGSVEEADIWAKTIFLMGKRNGKNWAKEKEIPCAMLGYDGIAWISPAMRKYLHEKNV